MPAQTKRRFDFLIVGAGLTGAVFARELTDAGKSCLVIEQRDEPGGNIRCEQTDGIVVHKYGAHIFHTDSREIMEYVRRYAVFNDYVHKVKAFYNGSFYSLPFNMFTFEQLWGVKTPEEARAVIAGQSGGISVPTNLEEQAIAMVGRDVYVALVKGYTEKQWGRDCSLLPPEIIKRLPLRFEYDDRYFNDAYQGIPIGGYNALIKELLHGSELMTSTEYRQFIRANPNIAEKTVYTGTIDGFFERSLGALEYRSLRFETVRLDRPDFQGCSVVNYTGTDVPYTRIIEHKYFDIERSRSDKTVLTYEYPEIKTADNEPYYPVNDSKNNELYKKYQALAEVSAPNVIFAGRLGRYKYFDMDDAIADARECAGRILGKQAPA